MMAESIEGKHAAELAGARPREMPEIFERMAKRKKMVDHKPSAGTLW